MLAVSNSLVHVWLLWSSILYICFLVTAIANLSNLASVYCSKSQSITFGEVVCRRTTCHYRIFCCMLISLLMVDFVSEGIALWKSYISLLWKIKITRLFHCHEVLVYLSVVYLFIFFPYQVKQLPLYKCLPQIFNAWDPVRIPCFRCFVSALVLL